ncbi:MAG: hypothetical protein IPN45_15225 [Actinomycetales bacterium]|nr:hypothetical protein [Actinomycetales bacterium]
MLPPPRQVSATEALVLAPGLPRGAAWWLVYWDGALEDDARLVIGLARTAAAYGADFVTLCRKRPVREDSVRLTRTS